MSRTEIIASFPMHFAVRDSEGDRLYRQTRDQRQRDTLRVRRGSLTGERRNIKIASLRSVRSACMMISQGVTRFREKRVEQWSTKMVKPGQQGPLVWRYKTPRRSRRARTTPPRDLAASGLRGAAYQAPCPRALLRRSGQALAPRRQ